MRLCPICRRYLRANDPAGSVFVPPDNPRRARPGHYGGVCSECCAAVEPEGPWGHYVVQLGLGADGPAPLASQPLAGAVLDQAPAGLCGMCRRYARENDHMEAVRVYREDLEPGDPVASLIPAHEPQGCFAACGECRKRHAPAILARLQRQGLAPAGMTADMMPEDMLA